MSLCRPSCGDSSRFPPASRADLKNLIQSSYPMFWEVDR